MGDEMSPDKADTAELAEGDWHPGLDRITRDHEGDVVTIELLSADFGDQLEAQRLPLAYLEYDPKDDMVIVAVGGRDGRYPVVLRHFVSHPSRILVRTDPTSGIQVVNVTDDDGSQTLITLQPQAPPS